MPLFKKSSKKALSVDTNAPLQKLSLPSPPPRSVVSLQRPKRTSLPSDDRGATRAGVPPRSPRPVSDSTKRSSSVPHAFEKVEDKREFQQHPNASSKGKEEAPTDGDMPPVPPPRSPVSSSRLSVQGSAQKLSNIEDDDYDDPWDGIKPKPEESAVKDTSDIVVENLDSNLDAMAIKKDDDYDDPWDLDRAKGLTVPSPEQPSEKLSLTTGYVDIHKDDGTYDEPWDKDVPPPVRQRTSISAPKRLVTTTKTESQVLKEQIWYCGDIKRNTAEDMLRNARNGSFLIRRSESNALAHSLSLCCGNDVLHLKIEAKSNGSLVVGAHSQPFHNLIELVEHYRNHKLTIKGALFVNLLYPVGLPT